ncbi:hypothetical protein CEP51_015809, partial [Fusarium floridanum]
MASTSESRLMRVSTVSDNQHGVTSQASSQNGSTPSNDHSHHIGWEAELRGPDGRKQDLVPDDYASDLTRDQAKQYDTEFGEGVSAMNDLGLRAASKLFQNSRDQEEATRSSSRVSEASVRHRVEQSLQTSQSDKQQYLSIDAFEKIFTKKAIKDLIRPRFPCCLNRNLPKKAKDILEDPPSGQGRRRLFGILVFMGRACYIDSFIDEGICDDDLPLERCGADGRDFTTRRARSTKRPGEVVEEARDEIMTLFRNWQRNDIELFYTYQAMFFVPFFYFQPTHLFFYPLASSIRLPWEKCKHKTNGGSGKVYKLRMHPSHHNFESSQGSTNRVYFALKEVNSLDRNSYRDEVEALQRYCTKLQKMKHLVQLLLTFQHGERLYLLFEWADGNLRDFWQMIPTVQPTPRRTRWVAEQCLGIAIAVKRIHGLMTWQRDQPVTSGLNSDREKYHGRHGDLKPSNILWFSKYGEDRHLLVVSDLGLTRYHSRVSKSHVSQVRGFTSPYCPPEVGLVRHISQKYDIWSLGCLYLEFFTWYLQGMDVLDDFESQRVEEEPGQPGFHGLESDSYYIIETNHVTGEKSARLKEAVED